jgi:hypothetical protein
MSIRMDDRTDGWMTGQMDEMMLHIMMSFTICNKVPPKFYFILFYLQRANLIGLSLQKNETTGAPPNRRFCFEV